jgi:alanine racemase
MRNFWCEIYLELIKDNIAKIRSCTGKKLMAVVKGNAYGLGVENISQYLDNKVDSFAVTYLSEAQKIRSSKDILIMTPCSKSEDYENIGNNIILTLDDIETVRKLSGIQRKFRTHIYINTGMNRFGIYPDKLDTFISDVRKLSNNIKIEGFYTHLHNNNNKKYTLNQIQLFSACLEKYKGQGYQIHMLNSTGFAKYDEYCRFDNMIRVGGILFGFEGLDMGYKKVYQFKASLFKVYKVEKGKNIGYGNLYKARKTINIGILDFGYIDKFYCPETIFDNKILSFVGRIYYKNQYRKSIELNGKTVKILGSVNMNYTLIDMENLSEDSVFDIEISPMAADSSIPKKYV